MKVSAIEHPRPLATHSRLFKDGFLTPRSIPERYEVSSPERSDKARCERFFFALNLRMEFPNETRMGFFFMGTYYDGHGR